MNRIARGLLVVALCSLAAPAAFAQCPAFPTTPPDINDTTQVAQTAWQIFVAAACSTAQPSQYPYVVWETWPTQLQVYPAANTLAAYKAAKSTATASRFHDSFLGMRVRRRKTSLSATSGGIQCPDSSVTIVEEVRINPSAASYIASPAPGDSLAFRPQQAAFATAAPPPFFPQPWPNVNFPLSAIEVKVDWVQYTGSCPSSLQGSVWTESHGGNCYALAGMHVISKLLPNWIWATFEPQNTTTNPNRCVVLGCNDPFGSVPAQTPPNSPGTTTQLSPALKTMMTSANLNPVWQNYRLDGVQVNFTNTDGSPTLLGNSVIECENAGVPLTQASCISCHAVSSINAQGTDGITNLNSNPVGNPQPYPPGFAPRDFVWSLLLACPGGGSHCGSTTTAKKK